MQKIINQPQDVVDEMLQGFVKAHPDRFIGFTNSPPVHYTKNGLAHGDETSPENITLGSLPDFANYLVPGLTDNIPTCGYVSFNIDIADWNLKEATSVELVIYDYPKRKPD